MLLLSGLPACEAAVVEGMTECIVRSHSYFRASEKTYVHFSLEMAPGAYLLSNKQKDISFQQSNHCFLVQKQFSHCQPMIFRLVDK